nr:GrpB family protein [Aliikangiella sp. G2MR2-5]
MISELKERVLEVVDYDDSWRIRFKDECELLKNVFGQNALNIEHIGSTAVSGLAAKPVIDILVEVESLEKLENCHAMLESHGYKIKGENGIEGRRYFQKGGNQRSHHVHAFKQGDEHLVRHRAFRDYLIEHPKVAEEYGDLKKRAAEKCNNDIYHYMELKSDYIQKHERIALAWYKMK